MSETWFTVGTKWFTVLEPRDYLRCTKLWNRSVNSKAKDD